MCYSDFAEVSQQPVIQQLEQQERGTHADEIETSMRLYIAPELVDMSKASKDDNLELRGGRLTHKQNPKKGVYSPQASGVTRH